MATSSQTAEIVPAFEELATYAVQEPAVLQYEAQVWSCAEQRQIMARLFYSVCQEQRGRICYRLLCIEPLGRPPQIN